MMKRSWISKEVSDDEEVLDGEEALDSEEASDSEEALDRASSTLCYFLRYSFLVLLGLGF